jgi:hypothetical protein
VIRSRRITLAAVGTALLANYWALESVLARRTDFDGSWISDLAARSEIFGWRFESLAILAGLALVGFAFLLLRPLGELSPMVRRGVLALLAAGVLGVVAGLATLDCAEGLEASCKLDYGALDLTHTISSVAEVLATAFAFAAIGFGLLAIDRGRAFSPYGAESSATLRNAGRVTLLTGALWALLAILTGLSFLSGDIDSIKGLAQRGGQVLFGCWLLALGVWADRRRQAGG